MEAILDFARGPLFRFCFVVMVLGLLRLVILDLINLRQAYKRAGDKTVPWKRTVVKSIEWLVPVRRVFHNRPFYSLFSILFHIGLLLVPIFLFAHVNLWPAVVSSWLPTLPKLWADLLTITTIVFALALFFGRWISKSSSALSRKQDYLWPLLLLIPFITGLICAQTAVGPQGYQLAMLFHVLSGDLILLLIPFTKIAHCVLMPMSQFVAALAWKFPAETDEAVSATLNKKGAPV
jgi:nitrate reductase gamma subunit